MTLAIAVALLTGVGTFLIVRGGAVRLILGFILLGHAANLVIIAAGGTFRREAPLVDGGAVDGLHREAPRGGRQAQRQREVLAL